MIVVERGRVVVLLDQGYDVGEVKEPSSTPMVGDYHVGGDRGDDVGSWRGLPFGPPARSTSAPGRLQWDPTIAKSYVALLTASGGRTALTLP